MEKKSFRPRIKDILPSPIEVGLLGALVVVLGGAISQYREDGAKRTRFQDSVTECAQDARLIRADNTYDLPCQGNAAFFAAEKVAKQLPLVKGVDTAQPIFFSSRENAFVTPGHTGVTFPGR